MLLIVSIITHTLAMAMVLSQLIVYMPIQGYMAIPSLSVLDCYTLSITPFAYAHATTSSYRFCCTNIIVFAWYYGCWFTYSFFFPVFFFFRIVRYIPKVIEPSPSIFACSIDLIFTICRDKKIKTLGNKSSTVDAFVIQSPVIVSVSQFTYMYLCHVICTCIYVIHLHITFYSLPPPCMSLYVACPCTYPFLCYYFLPNRLRKDSAVNW